MSIISTALRNFKEPTKEQLTEIFFSLPPLPKTADGGEDAQDNKMDINAVLSLGEAEDSYVSFQTGNYDKLIRTPVTYLFPVGRKAAHHAPVSRIFVFG